MRSRSTRPSKAEHRHRRHRRDGQHPDGASARRRRGLHRQLRRKGRARHDASRRRRRHARSSPASSAARTTSQRFGVVLSASNQKRESSCGQGGRKRLAHLALGRRRASRAPWSSIRARRCTNAPAVGQLYGLPNNLRLSVQRPRAQAHQRAAHAAVRAVGFAAADGGLHVRREQPAVQHRGDAVAVDAFAAQARSRSTPTRTSRRR